MRKDGRWNKKKVRVKKKEKKKRQRKEYERKRKDGAGWGMDREPGGCNEERRRLTDW